MNQTTVQKFHLQRNFLIVLTKNAEHVTKTLNEVFKIVMKVGLFNVNVLIENKNTTWTLHLYKPYIRSCYSFEIVNIGAFTKENYTKELQTSPDDLYPPEKFQFPNCPLLIATFPLKPFVIIEHFENETVHFSGLDVKIVDEISKTLNLKPVYIEAPDDENRGLIFSNGTVTGAMKMVGIKRYPFLYSNDKLFFYLGRRRICKHDNRFIWTHIGKC